MLVSDSACSQIDSPTAPGWVTEARDHREADGRKGSRCMCVSSLVQEYVPEHMRNAKGVYMHPWEWGRWMGTDEAAETGTGQQPLCSSGSEQADEATVVVRLRLCSGSIGCRNVPTPPPLRTPQHTRCDARANGCCCLQLLPSVGQPPLQRLAESDGLMLQVVQETSEQRAPPRPLPAVNDAYCEGMLILPG